MLRERHVIDAFKLATGPLVLALIFLFGAADRYAPWIYLGLHGTYGVLWALKSRLFGDKSWERPCTPARFALLVTGLSGYWAAPAVLVLGGAEVPPPWAAACIALFGLGVFLHFASDMQKHCSMAWRPGTLLTEGLWARTRNPNYLGELCIYAAFATLSMHPLPFALFALVIALEWWPNMRRKDASLSRYPAFAEYARRSGRLFPRLFGPRD
jgi:protein-S-isoprenylcysteine O-methyltransferase Ste14